MPAPEAATPDTVGLISELAARGLTIAVAESLTGGLLAAELIRPAGASAVVLGGVIAYDTELKHTLLGVDAQLLAEHGAVHADVARQMADGVREHLSVGGHRAQIGLATTGVAGPDPHNGIPAGTIYLGLSVGDEAWSRELSLPGSRDEVRASAVVAAMVWLAEAVKLMR